MFVCTLMKLILNWLKTINIIFYVRELSSYKYINTRAYQIQTTFLVVWGSIKQCCFFFLEKLLSIRAFQSFFVFMIENSDLERFEYLYIYATHATIAILWSHHIFCVHSLLYWESVPIKTWAACLSITEWLIYPVLYMATCQQ